MMWLRGGKEERKKLYIFTHAQLHSYPNKSNLQLPSSDTHREMYSILIIWGSCRLEGLAFAVFSSSRVEVED